MLVISWLVPQELLNRSALETQKLELLSEVSSLKLKLAALDRDHQDGKVILNPTAPASSAKLPVLCDSGSWQPLNSCFGVAEGPSHSGGEQQEPEEAEGASRLPAAASCLPGTIWFE